MLRISIFVFLTALQTLLPMAANAETQDERAARMAREETERAQMQQAENAKKVRLQLIVEDGKKTNSRNEKLEPTSRK